MEEEKRIQNIFHDSLMSTKNHLRFFRRLVAIAKCHLFHLEEAVEPLILILPDVRSLVYTVKLKCEKPADDLTQDESASIMLYTMSWDPPDECPYFVLNKILRSPEPDRQQELKPWYLYLRLLLNALFRLPLLCDIGYRGVKEDLSKRYHRKEQQLFGGDFHLVPLPLVF